MLQDVSRQASFASCRINIEPARAAFAFQLLLEGMSIQATASITSIDKNTIHDLIITVGENCEKFITARVRNMEAKDVQCDER